MKFAAIALILGCSSLVVYKSAEQSNLSTPTRPQLQAKTASIGGDIFKPLELFLHSKQQQKNRAITSLPAVPDPDPATTKEEAMEMIHKAAAKHGVSCAFVKSIVAAESNFNYAALSPKGAIGFMQLMPDTAQEFGATDPNVPEQNIDAGTRYLRWLMDRYQKRKNSLKHVIAAYNAGPANVDRYRGVPPFKETQRYVTRVLAFLHQFQREPNRS
jgi:soluble lytic murein transglycosylase-like protein